MSKATLIKASDISFSHRGGPPGHAEVGRAVSTEMSTSMGAGIAHFDQCSISWTVLYDEVIYVIDGLFRLVTQDAVLEGKEVMLSGSLKAQNLSIKARKLQYFTLYIPVTGRSYYKTRKIDVTLNHNEHRISARN